MTRIYCDRCGRPMTSSTGASVTVKIDDRSGDPKDLCRPCLDDLRDFFNPLPQPVTPEGKNA